MGAAPRASARLWLYPRSACRPGANGTGSSTVRRPSRHGPIRPIAAPISWPRRCHPSYLRACSMARATSPSAQVTDRLEATPAGSNSHQWQLEAPQVGCPHRSHCGCGSGRTRALQATQASSVLPEATSPWQTTQTRGKRSWRRSVRTPRAKVPGVMAPGARPGTDAALHRCSNSHGREVGGHPEPPCECLRPLLEEHFETIDGGMPGGAT